ncbi:MAG: hypothetical protein AAF845_07700 [Bacteroidota bacterium]
MPAPPTPSSDSPTSGAEAPPTSGPPSAASAPRRWDWRPKLRWFAAEYLIVVLGVLTAVGINAWWADRDAQTRERLVLEDLREDFLFNKAEIQRVRSFSDLSLVQFDRLATLPDAAVGSLSPDSVYTYVESTLINVTFDPVTGSLDALIASGNLGLIRDRALRERLNSFLEVLRDSDEEKQAVFDQLARGLEKQSRLGGPWGSPGTPFPAEPDDLLRLRNDADYVAHARLTRWIGWYYAEVELAEVEVAIDAVLVRLDENLTL